MELVRRVNELMRERAIADARNSIKFLESELTRTNVIEVKLAIDRLRKREAYCRMEERLTEANKREPQEAHAHVEEDLALSEMREHLARVMTGLPPAQQQVIQLAFYKGMSQREIAAHTGIPLGTIKTRIELGLKKISEALKGYEDLL